MSTMARSTVPLLTGVFIWLLAPSVPALAQNAEGMFVTVPNPITSEAVNRIKAQVSPRIDPKSLQRARTVIFDFNPDDKPSATADFGAALSLQNYILNEVKPQGVTTVAFVHAETTAHTVLPVLACSEIVMSKGNGAAIGRIVGDVVPPFGPKDSKRIIYQETLDKVGGVRAGLGAVVRKMYDKDVQLRRGEDKASPVRQKIFIDAREPDELKRVAGAIAVDGAQDGQIGLFATRYARDIELCKAIAETRAEVAEIYGLPPSSLRDDPLQGQTPDVFQWTLKKDIDASTRESVGRIIRDVQAKGGNVLVLIINAGGTDLVAARALADDLRKAQTGEKPLKIVALIPETAPGAGTVVALGCSEIVMTKTKPDAEGEVNEAEIGDFTQYLKKARPEDADAVLESIRQLATAQGYPAVLIDGMFKRDLEILRASRKSSGNRKVIMTREEFDRDNEAAKKATPANETPDVWVQDKVIKSPGQLLKLSATLAAELGLARTTVEGSDASAVSAVYGWPDAKSPDPGWLDRFADFLKQPPVTVLLVVIGFTGLILELKLPGLTVPGIIAALCFILVFWAHSKFSGQTFVLALLLFLMGLVLVGMEIFVIPGFGAAGISGILAMLAGLALVTLEKVPQTGSDWGELGMRVSQYMIAMVGAMILSLFIARFLPKLPGANRLVLNAPDDVSHPTEVLPGAGEAAGLIGAIGTSNTALRPAGVVKFGDKFVDVVSDGGYIPAGTRVQVIMVEGTRIVVKEV